MECQALRLGSVEGDLGLGSMTVTHILDPEAYEGLVRDLDAKSSSDDEDWDPDHENDDEDERKGVYKTRFGRFKFRQETEVELIILCSVCMIVSSAVQYVELESLPLRIVRLRGHLNLH